MTHRLNIKAACKRVHQGLQAAYLMANTGLTLLPRGNDEHHAHQNHGRPKEIAGL